MINDVCDCVVLYARIIQIYKRGIYAYFDKVKSVSIDDIVANDIV